MLGVAGMTAPGIGVGTGLLAGSIVALGFLPWAALYERLAGRPKRKQFLVEGRTAAELKQAATLALPDGRAEID